MKGFHLEFGIGLRGIECFYDGAIRWSKKFSDTFSRFDTIPAVTDSHPDSHVAVANTLYAIASRVKIANFSLSVYLTPEMKRFPLELGIDARRQKE